MTGSEERIRILEQQNRELLAENLRLKTSGRSENDSRDIREAAVEQVRQSNIRYQTIFENSLLGNKIISSDLKILQVNNTLVSMLGCKTKDELIGHHILEFSHPDYKADWQKLQEKLWRKNLPSFSLETCMVDKKGNDFWVSVTSILFTDDGGTLGFTIVENINERKLSQHNLLLRERWFRRMTDIMPQQVWSADASGNIRFVNNQSCAYFGCDEDELLINGWQDIIHPNDAGGCMTAWKHAIKTGSPFTYEFRLRNAGGYYHWFLSRAVPVIDDNQNTIWLGTNTDIDLQKAKETQKDEFLSIASHELKTPLTSLKLYNQLAAKNGSPDKKQEFIERSFSHIQRLERLISDLLDVSKINAGKMNYEIQPFEFNDMVTELTAIVQSTTTKHHIKVEINEPATVTGDKHRIEQVLNNYLANAIKYSPNANEVIICSKVVANNIVVSVQDHGIGISKDDLTKLFDRYYRADNAAMKFEGLGLGLYISAEVLKRHNGSLWIESEPGKGSIFYFILPLNGESLIQENGTDGHSYYYSNFLNINYNPEKYRLEADWVGYQNLESVKKGCMIMLDLLRKNNCSRVLNDNTKVMGNWSEAADWGAEYWFPAMVEAGLTRFAWIYSPSKFSQLAANKTLENVPNELQTRFFDNREEAEHWLNTSTLLN
ncbi:PAS domain-containing sensor histidine kinase [Mucilaginibacter terrae]|uniref:histidine kinase n=1 Tax=Mucilaginibacter terrae TaxID=1955052 RepID=A0ABU3GRP5_9SPHI|nr:PAS domain-containing sensor histidine kinase [Mucilaginibacter terrae]MDT3402236.1 PAS domain S-box-containing protein [Mucilaginibacter terrae]